MIMFDSDEKKVIDVLKKLDSKTMKVVGRGTLTMSVAEAKKSNKFIKLIQNSKKIISR